MKRHSPLIVALALTACATVPRGSLQNPAVAQLARPGPFQVRQYDRDWFDAARGRHVPVHIYAPDPPQPSMQVVIFSHGLGNSRLDYGYLGTHWASHGYVCFHPEHLGAGEDLARHGLPQVIRAGFSRSYWINVPLDLQFVVDQVQSDDALPQPLRGRVDRGHICVAGHSVGAYGALAVGGLRVLLRDGSVRNFRDPRVTAAIPISMSENFQPASYSDVAIPMLHVTGTRDWGVLYGTWSRKRRVPFNSIPRNDQYLLVVGGANHSTFSAEESASTHPAHDVIRVTSLLFLNAYLRNDHGALAALRDGDLAAALDGLGRLTLKSPPALRVGKIAIHTAPLFDVNEASQGALYRAANMMAVRTPERLIRRFLLFREGQTFDPVLLTESERNLRAFDFLKTVEIKAGPPHDGVVDVDVTTQDAFTTDVEVDFSNEGGRSLYDVNVTQLDLFGRGDAIGVRTDQGRERRRNAIELIDPATFGRYWNADALLAKNSDGNEERLAIDRPLFSTSTHFTASALTDHLLQTARVYRDATVSAQFRQEHRELAFTGGFALSAASSGNVRLLAGADLLTDAFAPVFGVAPDLRRFRFVTAGIDSTQFDLIKEADIDYGLKEEDFNLGNHVAGDVGYSSGNVWRLRGEEAFGLRLGAHRFALARLDATTRAGSTNRNTILSGDARIVMKFAFLAYPAAFVARVRADHGSHLDRDIQFFADGQNGLRAYPNFAFEGTKRIVFNAEQRLFLGRELFQIFEPGAAIFFDSGTTGTGFKIDFGGGVRFAIPRYESAIIRVDAAYAVNDSPVSKRGLVISIATTQAF